MMPVDAAISIDPGPEHIDRYTVTPLLAGPEHIDRYTVTPLLAVLPDDNIILQIDVQVQHRMPSKK